MSDYTYDGTPMKALSHLKDAGDAVGDMPNRDDDAAEHERCLRAAHAHVKAADGYLEDCRDSIDDDHDEHEGDPESGSTTPEERRARARRVRSSIGRA
jgi:hypothetical protein